MRFLMLLLLIAVLSFYSASSEITTSVSDDSSTLHLWKTIAPKYYIIDLGLDEKLDERDIFRFTGSCKIVFEVNEPATQIVTFHVHPNLEMNMFNIRLSDLHSNTTFILSSYRHDKEKQLAILVFQRKLIGIYSLEIEYSGIQTYNMNGLFRTTDMNETNTRWLIATEFKRYGARQLFPCWDEPAFTATFDISIRHSNKYKVVSNMPIRESESNEKSKTTLTRFETTPKISTHLLGIAITNLDLVIEDDVVNMWCKPELKQSLTFALNTTKMIKNTLINYLDWPQLSKIYFILMPGEFKIIRSWGLVIYSEQSLVVDDGDIDNLKDKVNVATKIAYEMAHLWFGNVVNPSWWTDEWLNEGIMMYIQTQVLEKIFKSWRINDFFVVKVLQDTLHKNVDLRTHSLVESTVKKFGESSRTQPLQYTSDTILIRMLQHIVGEEVFRDGLHQYLNKFNHKTTKPDDFWSVLQNEIHENISIQNVMTSWLNQSSYPLITVSRNYDNGRITIFHGSSMCETDLSYTPMWWIPIRIATSSSFDFSLTRPKFWLNQQNLTLTIDGYDKNDWIIINLQQIGYYRVNYDMMNWLRLTKVLNSEQYTDIHVLNRAQLIDDAYHFLLKDLVPFSSHLFFDLVGYLKRETDHIPWYSMSRILEDMAKLFYLPTSQHIKLQFLEIFVYTINNVGYDGQNDDTESTKIIRYIATYWACKLGNRDCLSEVSYKLGEHFNNPTVYIIPPIQQNWVFCMGMTNRDVADAYRMVHKYRDTNDTNFIKYINCAKSESVVQYYIKLLTDVSRISLKLEDRHLFYNQMVEEHAYDTKVLDLLLKDFFITNITIPMTERLIHIIRNVYSTNLVDKISMFVTLNIESRKINEFRIQDAVTTKLAEIREMKCFEYRLNTPRKYVYSSHNSGKKPSDNDQCVSWRKIQ